MIAASVFLARSAICAPPDDAHLSLASVLRTVRSHYPALAVGQRRAKAARERIPQERAWEDPSLTLETNIIGDTDQALTLQQTIPISGRNLSRERIAMAEASGAAQELRRTELEALRDTRVAYFQYAQAKGLLTLNKRNEDILKQLAEASRAKFESGNQTQSEVLTAETELARNAEARADLERMESEAVSTLNRLMGRLPQETLPPPEEPAASAPVFDLSSMQAHALRHSPEVQLAKTEVAAAKAKLELAHRQWIPDPTVGLKARRFIDRPDTEPMDEVAAQVSIGLPWVNHAKYSAGVREAEANLAASQAKLRQTEDETRTHVRDAIAKANAFSHHVALFREKILPLSRQSLASAQLGFESNKSTLLDVLNAQRRLRDDEATALQHLISLHVAIAELDAISGEADHSAPVSTEATHLQSQHP